MADLFDTDEPAVAAGPAPLAERMRPRSLDEYVGQEKILCHDNTIKQPTAAVLPGLVEK